MSEWTNALTVIALGLYAGSMLTEAGVFVPYWRAAPAREFYAWYAANDKRLLRFFTPFNVIALVLCLAAVTLSGWRMALPAACIVACVAMFPLYFAAANTRFSAGQMSEAELAHELARWSGWHWLRTVLSLVAFCAAVVSHD